MLPHKIDINDYDYPLPEAQIATHPLAERDAAKLLVVRGGETIHSTFKSLADYLPADCLLIRNDTRVVQARLLFKRKTEGVIEVFCLKPLAPHTEINQAMQQRGYCVWQCLAKKLKKWAVGEEIYLKINDLNLIAELISRDGKYANVKFSWQPENMSWVEVLDLAGKIPLPPYIHRDAEENDKEDYQTIYAVNKGAVAAPTAGLHFTPELISKIKDKGISIENITLHISAGTFQPVEVENAIEHPMHTEELVFNKDFMERMTTNKKRIIPAGTTTLRALESLYWFGVILENDSSAEFFIPSLLPYQFLKVETISSQKSFKNILDWMEKRNLETLIGHTEIFIFPSYEFKVCGGLITNFHQPKSTLLLLVSAMIGDRWKTIYQEAVNNNYRFLSYGDGMVILDV
ncbi:MAG: S-adenosylmethionine:tRNA ribosyltransferase-isomerase [Bacteroidetes bacterium]|nr:S-adenosylmethionine:tRNA ribosyltransferase-isomerase [Bacteroidota bacterium]